MDKISNGLAGMFVGLSCLLAQIMDSTMDVAILVQVIVTLTLDDAQWLLCGSGIVNINQRLTIDLLV